MDPIVVGCSLQGLAGIDWSVHLFLLFAVVFGDFVRCLTFGTLALSLLFRLLLMRNLRRLYKVVLGVFDGT
jgi:hypothetical protein